MKATWAALLVGTSLAAQTPGLPRNVAKSAKAAHAAANGKKARPSAAAPVPEPQPTAAQPVVPLRPSQMPSVAPRVSYQQGLLTVVAENSTVGDIIGAIRSATGIRIETQGGPSGDRVAAKIGPATPREVLLSLLQGSRYDYVILGSLNDPQQIERVILTPKLAAGAASVPQPQPVQQAQQRETDQQNDEGDFQDSEEVTDPGEPPLKGPEPQQQQQPMPQPPGNSTNPNPPLNQQPQTNPNGQVKTPEQLLRELQEQRQQQQQQQQNSNQDPNRPR